MDAIATADEVRLALERVVLGPLRSAPQLARFLRFVVEETLQGRGAQLKEYTIAVNALGRPGSFDPANDATVRVTARQLRFKLRDYYEGEGAGDVVEIALPKGGYVPLFTSHRAVAPRSSVRSLRRVMIPAVGTLIVAASIIAFVVQRPAPVGRTAAAGPAIAVLPFVNLTGDTADELISDGLSDEITTALARNPAARVVARTSAWKFKGQRVDVRDVGRQLGVGWTLGGSVLRSGDRYRVSVQLNDTGDGVTVWAEQYEVDRVSAFGLYDVIAQAVHESVAARVVGNIGVLPARRLPRDPQVNAFYLEGRYYWNQRTDSALHRAAQLLQAAVARDSLFAAGWAALAGLYATMEVNHVMKPGVSGPRALECAAKALALDPTLGEAWAARGLLFGFTQWRWAASDSAFQRAVTLSPSYASARSWYSNTLLARGLVDAALVQLERARELDPLSMPVAYGIAQANYYGRRWEAGLRAMDRVLELSPGYHWGLLLKGKLLKGAGRREEARTVFAGLQDSMELALLLGREDRSREVPRLIAALPEDARDRSQFWIATLFAQLGWRDSAFAWLDRAYEARQSDLVSILTDPMIDPLRGDPRFERMVTAVGLRND